MSALLSQLMRFASDAKPWHAAPFSLKIKRTTWSIATDSHVLFAVKLAGAAPQKKKDCPEDQLKEMLESDPPSDAKVVVVEDLKAWAGEAPSRLVPAGEVEPEHHGVLLEHAIDRRKLAFLFAMVTLPEVRGWVYKNGLLAFEPPKGQWRAFLAALKEPPDGDEPVFRDSMELAALVEGS